MDNREEFLQGVVNLLSARREGVVVLLVHEGNGLEIVSNTNDVIHKRGMLETAIDIIEEVRVRTDGEVEVAQGKAKEAVKLLSTDEGKVN